MTNISNTKNYLFASVARCNEESSYRVKHKRLHLMFSVFHSNTDLVENLYDDTRVFLVIRVLLRPDNYSVVIHHNQFFKELRCSFLLFFHLIGTSKFDNFIDSVIDSCYSDRTNLEDIITLKDVLFIFEGLT